MSRETMNVEERVWAAINLEKPDRLPVAPDCQPAGAAKLTGRTQSVVANDPEEALNAELEAFDKYGGWDMYHMAVPSTNINTLFLGMKVKLPGRELLDNEPYQVVEEEVVKLEDYNNIIEGGWQNFFMNDLLYRIAHESDNIPELINKIQEIVQKAFQEWAKRDTYVPCWAGDLHPFFKLSLTRSMIKFTEDLYYRPEIVEKALDRMVQETIKTVIDKVRATGSKIAWLCEERAGGFFYPLPIFEKYWWKYTVQIVDALWSEGIISLWHLDTSWDKNFHYFKKLPKGSVILHFDGTTDIFAAKKELGGHLCLMGDVHPSLLSLGKPEDVENYVKRLIDEVSYDGGLILSTGCNVPAAIKPDNFKALVDTGKNYEFSK